MKSKGKREYILVTIRVLTCVPWSNNRYSQQDTLMLFSMIMRRYCVFKRWKVVCAISEILAILIFDWDH